MLVVHVQLTVSHLQRVAGNADEPLHEVLAWIERPLENDHVAALRMTDRRKVLAGKRDLRPVHHLVDEKEVAYEQRLLHAAARDLERLDEKRPDEQEQDDRDRE